MPELEKSGGEGPEDKSAKAKQQQENEGQISKAEQTHEGDVEGANKGNAGKKSGGEGGTNGDAEVSYPPRTKKAREECQHVVDVLNSIVEDRIARTSTRWKNRWQTTSVMTHVDGTVSVGISCSGGEEDIELAQELEDKLNGGRIPKKYTVSAKSMPSESIDRKVGGNQVGICAEPKVAEAAHGNTSPVDGMDTRWRRTDKPNPHPYRGVNDDGSPVEASQMEPCATCGDPDNIKEYMNYANANKK